MSILIRLTPWCLYPSFSPSALSYSVPNTLESIFSQPYMHNGSPNRCNGQYVHITVTNGKLYKHAIHDFDVGLVRAKAGLIPLQATMSR